MSAEKYQSGATSRPMSGIEFSIQSLNEICMMSERKCSIGVMRWCFFFNLDRSSFLADVDCQFFQSISVKNIFCRDGLMFSWLNKWKHASFGRNKTSVELAPKNLADLHCKFFMLHQNKKSSSAVKKYFIRQREFLKKICTMRQKNIKRDYFTTDFGYWVFISMPKWNFHDVG